MDTTRMVAAADRLADIWTVTPTSLESWDRLVSEVPHSLSIVYYTQRSRSRNESLLEEALMTSAEAAPFFAERRVNTVSD